MSANGILRKLKPTLREIETFAPPSEEFVVEGEGKIRQAGTMIHHQNYVSEIRERAEKHLYVFIKTILLGADGKNGRKYLTKELHLPACQFLQSYPPYRKCLMFPRECGKTSIVGHGLPLHINIQPKESNVYFPGECGREQRVLLAGETIERSKEALRVIQTNCEANALMRAFWPDHFWQNSARKESKGWSSDKLILPRTNEWPDPTIRAIGVGGAITGAHPSVLIKDDLVTLDASQSVAAMDYAITWHKASRALINKPGSLEFIIGTHWSIHDLYTEIEQNDSSVAFMKKSIIEPHPETGEPMSIFPEYYTLDDTDETKTKISDLRKQHGAAMFSLLYMNTARDASLLSFDVEEVREYAWVDGNVEFKEDERDQILREIYAKKSMMPVESNHLKGAIYSESVRKLMNRRGQWTRMRA